MVQRLSLTQLASAKLYVVWWLHNTQTEPLEAGQSATSTRPCPRGARHPEVPEAHAATWPAQRQPLGTARYRTGVYSTGTYTTTS